MSDSDRIEIRAIRAIGFHGVLEQERLHGQEFVVDVALEVNTLDAARTDELSLTVNYAEVAQRVHSHITGEPHRLIETLANRIADDLLRYAAVKSVTVTVHKPHAPIPVAFSDVTVSITRRI